MKAYILGAGASVSAGYPLASQLLQRLSEWLDHRNPAEHWVHEARNRIKQISETFGSLDDFEGILGKLEDQEHGRVLSNGQTTYHQSHVDILHDCAEQYEHAYIDDRDTSVEHFYAQYLKSDLITALREFFFDTETSRTGQSAYDSFTEKRVGRNSSIITFNYDVALERALAKAGKWDIGRGYGFELMPDSPPSELTVFKLHGSANWIKHPSADESVPVVFPRDLRILGYNDLATQRSRGSNMPIDNAGTFVLPSPRKEFRWEFLWNRLWSSAADRLRSADEIFIHGYSMPTADARARRLLFDNIDSSAKIRVYCLNNSDGIAEEFHHRKFRNVRSFPGVSFETWAKT